MEAWSFAGLRPCFLQPSLRHQLLRKSLLVHPSPPRRCLSFVSSKLFSCKAMARKQIKPGSDICVGAQSMKVIIKENPSITPLQSASSSIQYISLLICRALLVAGIGLSLSKPARAESPPPVVVEATIDSKVAESEAQNISADETTAKGAEIGTQETTGDKVAETEAYSASGDKVDGTTENYVAETIVEIVLEKVSETGVEATIAEKASEIGVEATIAENVSETGVEATIAENVSETGFEAIIAENVSETGVEATIVENVSETKVQVTIAENVSGTGVQAELGSQQEEYGLGLDFWKDLDLSKGSMEFVLKDILEGDPTNVSALECLGKRLVEKDDFARSLIIFKKLEVLEPNEMHWKYMKAQAFEMTGQHQLAKETFQYILKFEPFSAKALQGLLIVMDQLGEVEKAYEIAEEAIGKAKKEKKTEEARNMGMLIGQFLMLKGHLHEALEQYDEIMEEDENDFRPYLCQGIIYSILGDKHMADQRFQSYNKLCPKDLPDRKYLDSIMIRAKRQGAKIDEAKQKQMSRKSGEMNDTKKKQSWKKPSKDELEA